MRAVDANTIRVQLKQQQQRLFKYDKNSSGADVVVYLKVKKQFTNE